MCELEAKKSVSTRIELDLIFQSILAASWHDGPSDTAVRNIGDWISSINRLRLQNTVKASTENVKIVQDYEDQSLQIVR